jgi:putative copper export protein
MFVNWNFFGPMVSYLIIYLKNHKTQWNSREGTANSSRDVYWAKATQQLTLSRRYSQLVANRCCQLACSLLEAPFVTRDVFFRKICSWWEAFVNRCSTVLALFSFGSVWLSNFVTILSFSMFLDLLCCKILFSLYFNNTVNLINRFIEQNVSCTD